MVGTIQRRVDMTDMIVCDEEIRLLVSKAQPKKGSLVPEIGQEVVLTKAIASGETEIEVEPLQENIKSGTVLDFKDDTGTSLGTVTVNIPPKKNANKIIINAATAGIANYAVALTEGIEQTLVLGSAVTKGDRVITLASGLTDWVEKGRVMWFENGVEVVASAKTPAGATTISIKPAPHDIPAGESSIIYNYLEVCSLNQLDDSSSANTINERNNKSGSGTGKAVTSYNDTITFSGNYVKGDFALFRFYDAKQDPELRGYIYHAKIKEPEGGQDSHAKVWLGQHGKQRPNDQTKKVSLTLEVDGIIEDTEIPDEVLVF